MKKLLIIIVTMFFLSCNDETGEPDTYKQKADSLRIADSTRVSDSLKNIPIKKK